MPYISVDIPVDGQWPTAADLKARNTLIDELDVLNLGEFSGAGGGMGSMDFAYTVSDAKVAEDTIKQVLAKTLPDRKYSIRVSED